MIFLSKSQDHKMTFGTPAYTAFRHFFTHAYGFDLHPQRLALLVQEVRAVCACFKKEAKRFVGMQVAEGQCPSPAASGTQSRMTKV
jgi:hypothetical protein